MHMPQPVSASLSTVRRTWNRGFSAIFASAIRPIAIPKKGRILFIWLTRISQSAFAAPARYAVFLRSRCAAPPPARRNKARGPYRPRRLDASCVSRVALRASTVSESAIAAQLVPTAEIHWSVP
jgi:hypothetical protein